MKKAGCETLTDKKEQKGCSVSSQQWGEGHLQGKAVLEAVVLWRGQTLLLLITVTHEWNQRINLLFCISRGFQLVLKCHLLTTPHVEQIRVVKYLGLKSWYTSETPSREERSQLLLSKLTHANNCIVIKANISEFRGFYTGLFHIQIKKRAYRTPDLFLIM